MAIDRSRRNVVLLALCLALGMSASSLIITSAAVVGHALAVDKSLATLPVACMFIGTMVTTIPASLLMKRIGRRPGFGIGVGLGLIGTALTTAAVWHSHFALFCLGLGALGGATAFVQYYRFAAADTASAAFRPTAISLVMGGGVLAAVIGPNLAAWSRDLLAPVTFAGTFASLAVLQLLSLVLLAFLDIPRPPPALRQDPGRGLGAVARQPAYGVAVIAAALGYGVMTLVMTATPLAILDCSYGFDDSAFVIQWHVLGMYAPSFVTGRLIRRFGVLTVMQVGGLCYLATAAINLSGTDLILNFWLALVLLGVGWNFLFVGGTTLLTTTYGTPEKAKAQGLNDFLVFTTMTVASLSSGWLHAHLGWSAVNLAILPATALVMAAVAWLQWRRRAAPA